jgi:hypothetical protein
LQNFPLQNELLQRKHRNSLPRKKILPSNSLVLKFDPPQARGEGEQI